MILEIFVHDLQQKLLRLYHLKFEIPTAWGLTWKLTRKVSFSYDTRVAVVRSSATLVSVQNFGKKAARLIFLGRRRPFSLRQLGVIARLFSWLFYQCLQGFKILNFNFFIKWARFEKFENWKFFSQAFLSDLKTDAYKTWKLSDRFFTFLISSKFFWVRKMKIIYF